MSIEQCLLTNDQVKDCLQLVNSDIENVDILNIVNISYIKENIDIDTDNKNTIKTFLSHQITKESVSNIFISFLGLNPMVDKVKVESFFDIITNFKLWGDINDDGKLELSRFISNNDSMILRTLLSERKICTNFISEIQTGLLDNKTYLETNIEYLISEKFTSGQLKDIINGEFINKMVCSYIQIWDGTDIYLLEKLSYLKKGILSLTEYNEYKVNQLIEKFWINFSEVHDPISIPIPLSHLEKWLDKISDKDLFHRILHSELLFDNYNRFSVLVEDKKLQHTFQFFSALKNAPFNDDNLYNTGSKDYFALNYIFMRFVYDYLSDRGCSLEELIFNYVNEDVRKLYDINNFEMDEIYHTWSVATKIELFANRHQRLCKLYYAWSEYGEIDLSFVEHIKTKGFNELKSIIPNKFVDFTIDDNQKIDKITSTHNYFPKYMDSDINFPNESKPYNTLFSKDEVSYLNYCLNDKEYNNSLGIRNKYAHGSANTIDNEELMQNYMILLQIILLTIARIDEEFIWKTYSEDNV